MSEQNQKNFEDKIERTKEIVRAADEAIERKRAAIGTEAESIEELGKFKNNCGFVIDLYESGATVEVGKFSDKQFLRFMIPINDIITSGSFIHQVSDESQKAVSIAQGHSTILAATGSTTSTAAINAEIISAEMPQFFVNRVDTIEKYKPEDEFMENVGYIRSQLPRVEPDITEDFEYLIKKFNAFKTSRSDYQDLIGSRSTFFFRLIFEFAITNYPNNLTRKEQIYHFVFGSASPIPAAEPMIVSALDIYRELSAQNASTGISAKEGKITPQYAEVTFRRLISIVSSLLRLREKYFQP